MSVKGRTMNFIDLFAGAGGLSEGFMRERFSPVAFVEKCPNACNTLKTRLAYRYLKDNGKAALYLKYLQSEISREEFYSLIPNKILNAVINEEISKDTLGKIFAKIDSIVGGRQVDLILGGAPCQSYSIARRHLSPEKLRNDPRNYLYKYYIDFLKHYKPNAFLFENVPGFLNVEKGKYFLELLKSLRELGYSTQYKILNAADFNVLQNRKRVFIVGTRTGQPAFIYPEPPPNNYTLKDIFSDLPQLKAGQDMHCIENASQSNDYLEGSLIRSNEFNIVLQHRTRKINNQDKEIYKIAVNKYLNEGKQLQYSELPKNLQTHKNKFCFVDRYKVLNVAGFSHTILSHLAKDGHHFIYPDSINLRSISIREAARIQSFPDDYFFEGSLSSCFRQIGNAVPVLLAQSLAKQFRERAEDNEILVLP